MSDDQALTEALLESTFAGKKKKKSKAAVQEEPEASSQDLQEPSLFSGELKKKKKKKVVQESPQESLPSVHLESGQAEEKDYTYAEVSFFFLMISSSLESFLSSGSTILSLWARKRNSLFLRLKLHARAPKKRSLPISSRSAKGFFFSKTQLKRMHRQPDHLIQYLFAELGTTGSIDGAQRLLIKGRFQQKQIEIVLKRYIGASFLAHILVEYVQCKTCRSADTALVKENRLFFLQCEACGSSRTVSAIKTGFMAQTGKRSALRNAAG